jgi:hypothetical protein
MRFLIDENLSVRFAESLRAIGQDIDHVTEVLYEGAPDTEVLEFAGTNGYFLITKDNRIRYKPNEKAALRRHQVGVFLLGGKNMTFLGTESWSARKKHRSPLSGGFEPGEDQSMKYQYRRAGATVAQPNNSLPRLERGIRDSGPCDRPELMACASRQFGHNQWK